MFTTCPACRMNLAVTANDLRIGQGYVRCGRCERVFNALMSLAEDLDLDEQSGLAAHGTASMPKLDLDEIEARPGSQTPLDPTPVDIDLDVLESAETGTVETIVLEGDTFTQVEEHIDEEEVRQRLRDITGDPAPEPEPELKAELDTEFEAESEPANDSHDAPQPPAEELDADAAVGNAPRRHWAWRVAAVLLLLLLAGQVVHHHRQQLVANRWLGRPLQMAYAPFGIELEPNWDLAAYKPVQLGGEALAPNSTTLVLKASIQNRAPAAQPPPLIRVRLQDRYGNTLSTTAVPPADYLNGPVPARMAPDQRLDAELRLEDSTRQAVGWDLVACLPGADGKLHCADDP